MSAQSSQNAATVGPATFAVGVAVLLVGLIVNPLVLGPLGGAITLAAGFAWVRHNRRPRLEIVPAERRSAEYLAKFLPEEIERWGKVIRAAGISAE